MTTTEDTVSSAPPARRQPVALSVAVGVAVAVSWVLYRHYWLSDLALRVIRWNVLEQRLWVYTLVLAMLMCVPYAVVLLWWGRDLRRGAAGALAAVAAGLEFWGVDRVFQGFLWASSAPGPSSIRAYTWLQLLGPALLVPLAWGLARRTGRSWLPGVVAGPVVAAILYELELRSSWWYDHVRGGTTLHWQLQAVVFVAPFVAAALVCWAIESFRSSA